MLTLALAGAAAALSLVGSVVAEASSRAGPTRLAVTVSQVIEPSLLFTLVAIGLANVAALVAMWRLDARSRAGEAATLIAAGWTRSQVLLTRLAGGVAVSVPAAVVGAASTLGVSIAIGSADPLTSAAASALPALALGLAGPLIGGVAVDPMQRP